MINSDNSRQLQFGLQALRHNGGRLYLPYCDIDLMTVELLLMDSWNYLVESERAPIRFNKHIGTRIIVGGNYDNSDLNPKFVYDKLKNEWVLMCHGYVLFPEIEINSPYDSKKGA